MVETKVKNLTQAQKNYLVKRVNEIANAKITKLGGKANYGSQVRQYYYNVTTPVLLANEYNLGSDAIMAIIEGTVKLRSKADLMAEIKSMGKSKKIKGYGSLNVNMFIDLESLEKFNNDLNKKKKADHEAKQKRLIAVRDEADKLKDSVMLESSLAKELLDKFEKKEF